MMELALLLLNIKKWKSHTYRRGDLQALGVECKLIAFHKNEVVVTLRLTDIVYIFIVGATKSNYKKVE